MILEKEKKRKEFTGFILALPFGGFTKFFVVRQLKANKQ